MRWIFRILLAAGLTAAVALWIAGKQGLLPARLNPFTPLDLAEPPGLLTEFRLWRISSDPKLCLGTLRAGGATAEAMPARTERTGCQREDTVVVSRLSQASLKPEEMRCDLALRLYLLERHGLQPLARHHLGADIDRIEHFGSYSCRTIRGGRRLSEHATANAFDIAGFRLSNGRTISLKKDWPAGGPSGRFLREARDAACLMFNMVLSPDYNADHADHFHIDMGWLRGCH